MASIIVRNPHNRIEWTKQLDDYEFKRVHNLTKNGGDVSPIKGAFIPIRTHNFQSFVEDLFFPTMYSFAMQKTKNSIIHVAAAIFDTITLPIRLLTAIPRVWINPKREDHPFYKYLQEQNVSKKLLETDYVKTHFKWTKNQSGTPFPKRTEIEEKRCNSFIEFPRFIQPLGLISKDWHDKSQKA